MRYSTEPRFRKYVKGYGLLSFVILIQLLIIKIYQNLLLKNGLKFMISQKKIITQIRKL